MGYLKIFHKFILSFQWHSECVFASECLSSVVIYHLSTLQFVIHVKESYKLLQRTVNWFWALSLFIREANLFFCGVCDVYIPCVGHDTSYYQNLWKCTEVFWYSFPFRPSTEFYIFLLQYCFWEWRIHYHRSLSSELCSAWGSWLCTLKNSPSPFTGYLHWQHAVMGDGYYFCFSKHWRALFFICWLWIGLEYFCVYVW